jgi:acetyl-CoA C-acetyltransferase
VGPAVIETYTVVYDKEGAPVRGIVLARLPDGRRAVTNTAADRAVLEALAAEEAVGRRGHVVAGAPVPRFDLD